MLRGVDIVAVRGDVLLDHFDHRFFRHFALPSVRSRPRRRISLRQVATHRIIPEGQAVVNADYLAVHRVQEPAAEGQDGLAALLGGEDHLRRHPAALHVREELLAEYRPEGLRVHRAEPQHVDAGSLGQKMRRRGSGRRTPEGPLMPPRSRSRGRNGPGRRWRWPGRTSGSFRTAP